VERACYRTGIDRIQFALAGMNALINHDLALALLATGAELGIVPALDSREHADYESVSNLLNNLLSSTLNMLATDMLGILAEDTGTISPVIPERYCRSRRSRFVRKP
jgi:Family of unknown function (DUF5995)